MARRLHKPPAKPVLWVKRTVLLTAGIGLGVATLVFVTLNREAVSVDFYFGYPVEVPLWSVVVVCLLLGWLIPRLLGITGWFRHARDKARLRRRIDELEAEVVELRNIPLDFDSDEPPPAEPAELTSTSVRARIVEVVTNQPDQIETENGDVERRREPLAQLESRPRSKDDKRRARGRSKSRDDA